MPKKNPYQLPEQESATGQGGPLRLAQHPMVFMEGLFVTQSHDSQYRCDGSFTRCEYGPNQQDLDMSKNAFAKKVGIG